MKRRLCLAGFVATTLLSSAGMADSIGAEERDVLRADCRVRTVQIDARGIATVAAECHWPLPAAALVAMLRDLDQLGAALSSLAEARRLADGRVVQVHRPGWPLDDRQVTLDWRESELPGGGVRFDYRVAERQEPLPRERVGIRVDDGRWAIRSDGAGGTRLSYTSRYDAGGTLKPWVVRRFQKEGVAKSLAELRAVVETRLARSPAR